ncbi:MAG TPA: hypothetical protein VI386_31820 [Candidatus Sulfotelmatobacter sp.]
MADNRELQQIVERAVGKVFADHMPLLQTGVTQCVMQALPSDASASSPVADADNLRQIVAGIHASSTQKDILRALLDGGSTRCQRIALFVVKGKQATGWQARGFDSDESVKDFSLDMNAAPVVNAYQNRAATGSTISEMDQRFVEQFGRPSDEQLLIVPLVLKDKVAALLYADCGSNGKLDAPSIELLVMVTSAWLELTSLRKQTQKEVVEGAFERASERFAAPVPVQPVSSLPDPFATHAPRAVAAPPEQPAAEVVEVSPSVHAAVASAAAAPAVATDPHASLSPEDAEMHRKAQRFARLLVDEIKLYNQAKVTEGRRNRDIYGRLKEDIEKSRSTYQKRFSSTSAASGEYFEQELVRSLAEDDPSLMGAGFQL